VGQKVTFTASASGSPTPSVQWQVSTDGGKTWSNLSDGSSVSGSATDTLTLSNIQASEDGSQYQAVFTNSIGTATTSAATLTVQYAPIVTINPFSQTATAGQKVTFTVAANADPAATVQWQVSTNGGSTFTNISGATSTTLTLTGVTPAMNGYKYQAVFSTSAGSAVSLPATLTVSTSSSSSHSLVLNVPPLLALLGQLIGGIETVNANDTETVMYSLFGFSLVTAHYDGSGNFIDATLFGFSIPNWIWYL
jgi:hypothetical protein